MERYFKNAPLEIVELWYQFEAGYRLNSVMIRGHEWQYIHTGHGVRPLVLLPGEERFAEYWFRLIWSMQKDQQLLAVTLPPLNSIQDFAQGLVELLDRLGIVEVDLLGASLGGCIAQEFVRSHPQRVRHLILANSYTPRCRTPQMCRLYAAVNPFMPALYLRTLKRWHLRALVSSTKREHSFWQGLGELLYDRYLAQASKPALLSPVRALADFARYSHYGSRDLADWPGRIMILESINDPGASESCRKSLNMLYPQATLHTLANSGHTPGYSMPVGISVLVDSFLQRL